MILAFRRPCADHRAALLDFVDRQARSAATPGALAHLDRCRSCERELADTALAITALRRLHLEVAAAEPPDDAWLRLRARVARPVDPWRWRTTLGGLASGALLVAVVVMPVRVAAPGATEMVMERADPAGVRRESAYLANVRAGTLPSPQRVERDSGSVPVNLPPEIANVRKEVPPAHAPARSSEPI